MNPLVTTTLSGPFLAARAFLSVDGETARIDQRLGHRRSRPREERLDLPYGELEVLEFTDDRFHGSVTGQAGRTLLVSAPSPGEGGATAGQIALVRLRVPARPEFANDLPSHHPAGILSKGFTPAHLSFVTDPDGRGDPEHENEDLRDARSPPVSADELGEAVVRALGPARLSGSRTDDTWRRYTVVENTGDLVLSPRLASQQSRIDSLLIDLVATRLRTVQLDLWEGSVPAEVLAGTDTQGAVLPDAWLERFTKPGLRLSAQGLHGKPFSVLGVAARTFVSDLEMVSGGTGQTTVEVGDPVISVLRQGLFLGAEISLVPDTPWARLELEAEHSAPPRDSRRVRTRTSAALEIDREADSPRSVVRPAGKWLDIELPEENLDLWRHSLTVPLGKPVLLSASPDPARADALRVLLVVVTDGRGEESGDSDD